MKNTLLTAQDRDLNVRASLLRKDNLIPAVVYGHDFKNLHLQMDYQTFRRVFEKATFSTIIHLKINENDTVPVLVHEVQYHPVTDEIIHVDFYKVRMDEKVTTHITLEFVGESEAVRLGALLNTTKHDLEVTCLPSDLVNHIDVDLSLLKNIGDSLRVSDIPIPPGIDVLDNPEDTVVSASEPRVLEEDAVEETEEGTDETATTEASESEESSEKREENGNAN